VLGSELEPQHHCKRRPKSNFNLAQIWPRVSDFGSPACYSTKTNSRNRCYLIAIKLKLHNEHLNFSSPAPLPLQQTEPSSYPAPSTSGTQTPSPEATSLKKVSSLWAAEAFWGLLPASTTPRCSHSPLLFGKMLTPIPLPVFQHPVFTHQPAISASSSSLQMLTLPAACRFQSFPCQPSADPKSGTRSSPPPALAVPNQLSHSQNVPHVRLALRPPLPHHPLTRSHPSSHRLSLPTSPPTPAHQTSPLCRAAFGPRRRIFTTPNPRSESSGLHRTHSGER